ncbi:MAG: hypothetical protein GKR90_24625 [Pseudomonadales bacterium]|nr:hypothetical protein [Pseudomonadales bacterium]
MGEADLPPVTETHSEFTVGGWLVDPGQLTLSKDGEVRHLEPKAMDVLVYLVERVPDTVSNEEIQDKVWRGVVVGDNAVHLEIGDRFPKVNPCDLVEDVEW